MKPIYGMLVLILLLSAGCVPMVQGASSPQAADSLLRWNDLPKTFVQVASGKALEEDGSPSFYATFRSEGGEANDNLWVMNKIVVAEPQAWRRFLRTFNGMETTLSGATIGEESVTFRGKMAGSPAVLVTFLKGNAFVEVLVLGSNSDTAQFMTEDLARLVAGRLPGTVSGSVALDLGELHPDGDVYAQYVREMQVGTLTNYIGGEINEGDELTARDLQPCFRLRAQLLPRKFITAVYDRDNKRYIARSEYLAPADVFAECEAVRLKEGHYTFVLWEDDHGNQVQIRTTDFTVVKKGD